MRVCPGVVAVVIGVGACGSSAHDYVSATQPGAPWPTFRHDQGFTARADVRGARNGTVRWKLDTHAEIGTASPVVAADGTIYLGNTAGTFVAVHPDGSLGWQSKFGPIEGTPVIAWDGSIYVGSNDAKLRVLRPDGSEASTMAGDSVRTQLVVDDEGNSYFVLPGRGLCTAPRGGEVSCPWSNGFGAAIAAGRIYVEVWDGVRAYDMLPPAVDDPQAGALVALGSLGAIGADGTVYMAGVRLEAHDSRGKYLWSSDFAVSDEYSTNLAVASATSVYYVGGTRIVSATPSGTAWSADVGASIEGALAVDSDGAVYLGADDGRVYAFDSTGKRLFAVQTGGPVRSSPAIGADGTVYVGSDDGFLYAIGP